MQEFDIKQMTYSVDYISGIVYTPFVSRFFNDLATLSHEKLAFTNFKLWSSGLNFYKIRFCLNDQSYFTVAYNEPLLNEPLPEGYDSSVDNLICSMAEGKNRGIFLSISGDGLRYLGDELVKLLFQLLSGYEFNCTRLDLCCDCYDPDNIYVPLLLKSLSNVYCQRGFVPGEFSVMSRLSHTPGNLRKYSNIDNLRDPDFLRSIGACEIAPNCFETINYTWGRKDSTKCQFRIYDKWLEVKTVPRLKAVADSIISDCAASVSNYWYRFEYEMHKVYANDLFHSLASESTSVPGAFAWCAENCFYPVLMGTSKTLDLCAQQKSDVWFDFIDFARRLGDSDVVRNIYFVQSKFYSVEDRVKYVKNNLPLYYMGFCLFKAYPWLLDRVLEDGRQSFFTNKKNIPFINFMNEKFFETNIFSRRDIPKVTENSFEQLPLDSLFDDFPGIRSL